MTYYHCSVQKCPVLRALQGNFQHLSLRHSVQMFLKHGINQSVIVINPRHLSINLSIIHLIRQSVNTINPFTVESLILSSYHSLSISSINHIPYFPLRLAVFPQGHEFLSKSFSIILLSIDPHPLVKPFKSVKYLLQLSFDCLSNLFIYSRYLKLYTNLPYCHMLICLIFCSYRFMTTYISINLALSLHAVFWCWPAPWCNTRCWDNYLGWP